MKIKDGYVLKEVAGNTIVVNVGGALDFNGMITLNETGKTLWKVLQEGTDSDGLVEALLREFEVDRQTATADVNVFVNKLKEAGIVE